MKTSNLQLLVVVFLLFIGHAMSPGEAFAYSGPVGTFGSVTITASGVVTIAGCVYPKGSALAGTPMKGELDNYTEGGPGGGAWKTGSGHKFNIFETWRGVPKGGWIFTRYEGCGFTWLSNTGTAMVTLGTCQEVITIP